MDYIHRHQEQPIIEGICDGKIAIIYGPRQIGKTTLAKSVAKKLDPNYKYLNADEPDVALALSGRSSTELRLYIGPVKTLVIDEAQRVSNIGITLKLLADTMPEMKVIATGSSSFELSDSVNEPLTGRAYYYTIWPLALSEVADDPVEQRRHLEDQMIYGQYPAIALGQVADKKRYLANLVQNYLYRDLLSVGVIRSEAVLLKLLQLLAYQIGNQVSINELASELRQPQATVANLIDLLEKAFVIHRLHPYAKNVRNTIRKQSKVYFTDLGVRNALIGRLAPLDSRDDRGSLWENYVVNEMRKINSTRSFPYNDYFIRDYSGSEVDYIQEREQVLTGFEVKWSPKKIARAPKVFTEASEMTEFHVVNSDNFVDFI